MLTFDSLFHAHSAIVKSPNIPLTESHHPLTFKSRGVAMPFTTPLLAGTRIRGSKRDGVELVVPNPSGSRGVYILRWPGIRALCNPTVHDTLLFQRCSELTAIEPASIRETALDVAREGHAGQDTAKSASAAIAHDRSQRLTTHFVLVMGLVEQLDPTGQKIGPSIERAVDLDKRASAVLHHIAPSLGRPAAHLAGGLTAIGNMFASLGVAPADRDARIPRVLTRLEAAYGDLASWVNADPNNDIGGLGQAIAVAMRTACESGTRVLEKARSALMDMPGLLRRWIQDADSLSTWVARCDWLLDGWERISLLWLTAGNDEAKRAALLEMAPLMPVQPREVMEWTDTPVSAETMKQACRVTSHEDGWRTGGSAFALIGRNERLLAMSAWTGPSPVYASGGLRGS